jgi:hypothetical protein
MIAALPTSAAGPDFSASGGASGNGVAFLASVSLGMGGNLSAVSEHKHLIEEAMHGERTGVSVDSPGTFNSSAEDLPTSAAGPDDDAFLASVSLGMGVGSASMEDKQVQVAATYGERTGVFRDTSGTSKSTAEDLPTSAAGPVSFWRALVLPGKKLRLLRAFLWAWALLFLASTEVKQVQVTAPNGKRTGVVRDTSGFLSADSEHKHFPDKPGESYDGGGGLLFRKAEAVSAGGFFVEGRGPDEAEAVLLNAGAEFLGVCGILNDDGCDSGEGSGDRSSSWPAIAKGAASVIGRGGSNGKAVFVALGDMFANGDGCDSGEGSCARSSSLPAIDAGRSLCVAASVFAGVRLGQGADRGDSSFEVSPSSAVGAGFPRKSVARNFSASGGGAAAEVSLEQSVGIFAGAVRGDASSEGTACIGGVLLNVGAELCDVGGILNDDGCESGEGSGDRSSSWPAIAEGTANVFGGDGLNGKAVFVAVGDMRANGDGCDSGEGSCPRSSSLPAIAAGRSLCVAASGFAAARLGLGAVRGGSSFEVLPSSAVGAGFPEQSVASVFSASGGGAAANGSLKRSVEFSAGAEWGDASLEVSPSSAVGAVFLETSVASVFSASSGGDKRHSMCWGSLGDEPTPPFVKEGMELMVRTSVDRDTSGWSLCVAASVFAGARLGPGADRGSASFEVLPSSAVGAGLPGISVASVFSASSDGDEARNCVGAEFSWKRAWSCWCVRRTTCLACRARGGDLLSVRSLLGCSFRLK